MFCLLSQTPSRKGHPPTLPEPLMVVLGTGLVGWSAPRLREALVDMRRVVRDSPDCAKTAAVVAKAIEAEMVRRARNERLAGRVTKEVLCDWCHMGDKI